MPRAFAPNFPDSEPGMNLQGAPLAVVTAAAETSWLLQAVRDQVKVPLDVTSLYRTPERNAALPGASDTSQHMDGTAADFVPVGISLYTFAVRFLEAERAGKIPLYGQLIFYPFTSQHVHISLPTRTSRRAKLIKTREGTGFVSFSLQALRAGVASVATIAVVVLAGLYLLARKGA